ncbi:MAG: phage tail protein [Parabacteroides sp.]|nr:phage tail protein [Parabacteroides sp.]
MEKVKQLEVCNMRYVKLATLLDNSGIGAYSIQETQSLNEITELTFSYPIDEKSQKYMYLTNENLILCNDEYYRIKTANVKHDDDGKKYIEVTCRHLSESLQYSTLTLEEQTPKTVIDLFKIVLGYENDKSTTGWSIGTITVDTSKKRGMEAVEDSRFSILLSIAEMYSGMLVFHSQTMTVDMLKVEAGDNPKFDLRVSKDLKNMSVSYDTSEMITRLYCFGDQDDNGNEINIMKVNPTGKAYIENYDYFLNLGYTQDEIDKDPALFTKTSIWRESNYINAQDLYDDGVKKLKDMSVPEIDIEIQALDLSQYGNYRTTSLSIGDTLKVIDADFDSEFLCNVTSISKDYDQPYILDISVTNLVQYKDMMSKLFSSISTANTIISTGGKINGSKVEHLKADQIDDLSVKYITSEKMESDYLKADEINGNFITAKEFNSEHGVVKKLEAAEAEIDVLKSNQIETDKIVALKADIVDADIANIKFKTLKGDYGEFKNLSTENFTAINGDIKNLNTDNATINKALINKAAIADLDAAVARIGTLETNSVTTTDFKAAMGRIDVLETTSATIENLNAAVARLKVVETDTANINTLLNGNLSSDNIQAGGITSDKLTIAKGFITDAMISSLDADKINTGKINTSKISVGSGSGNLNIADNTLQITDGTNTRVQIGKDASNDYSMYVWDKNGKLMFDALGIHEDAIKSGIIRNDMVSDTAAIAGSKLDIESVISSVNGATSKLDSSIVKFNDSAQTLDVAFSSMKKTVDGVKTTSDNNTTALNVANGKISNLISNTTITKDGVTTQLKDEYSKTVQTVNGLSTSLAKQQTTLDSATGSIASMQDKQSTFDTTLDGIKSNVSSVESTLKTKADSSTVDTLSSNYSELSSTIDGFKSDVSKTYQTKTDATTANDAINKSIDTINTKSSTLQNTVDGLTNNVSSLETTVSKKADSTELEKTNASLSSLTNDVSGFKSTVSNTYATKETANAISNTASTALSNANSSVQSVSVQYAQNTNTTTAPTTGWSTTSPAWSDGKYIWQRTVTTTKNGTSTSGATCISGDKGEDATLLHIDSSHGNMFKNNAVSTVLTVTVFHGASKITDAVALKNVFGAGAYIEWKWKRIGEDAFYTISSEDSRISNGGFKFTLSPDDVDTKVVFECILNN